MSSRRNAFLVILVVLLAGGLLVFGALQLRGTAAAVGARHVLTFDVPSAIDEDQPEVDFFSPGSWRRPRLTMFELLETLHAAARDPQVRGLVLHVGSVDWGWAKIAEVRDAIAEIRAAKKPVYVGLEGGGEPELFLASAATRIAMPPAASLQLNGLSASALFLRGTFDKVGVRPNFLHVGKYKSAPESYTRTGFSEPAREALSAILDDTYRMLADSLGSSRAAASDSIRAWMNRGPYSALEVRKLGLIDTLLDRIDLDSLGVRRAGRGAAPLRLARYAERRARPHTLQRIALITASGTISEGKSRVSGTGDRVLGAETIIDALRRARSRASIRAVVLRIDSPGGDATASDEIWHEVERCRQAKPVIVSMSDVAASGGYYIAAAADTIVAQPATITGSIGIFGGKFNVRGLYEKLGLSVETITTGPRAQMYSPFRDFTDEEAGVYQAQLQKSYERFLDRVAKGRGRTPEWADSVGQGRIWSGEAAARLGLVDLLGGLDVALRVARARGGFDVDENVQIEQLPAPEEGFFDRFLSELWSSDETRSLDRVAALVSPLRVLEQAADLGSGAALAILPYTITIR